MPICQTILLITISNFSIDDNLSNYSIDDNLSNYSIVANLSNYYFGDNLSNYSFDDNYSNISSMQTYKYDTLLGRNINNPKYVYTFETLTIILINPNTSFPNSWALPSQYVQFSETNTNPIYYLSSPLKLLL